MSDMVAEAKDPVLALKWRDRGTFMLWMLIASLLSAVVAWSGAEASDYLKFALGWFVAFVYCAGRLVRAFRSGT